MTVIQLSVGKDAGIRSGDLVGAIAGEANIDSSMLGAIKIGDETSLVEVPESLADEIMAALRQTKIRGQRVNVRRLPDQKR